MIARTLALVSGILVIAMVLISTLSGADYPPPSGGDAATFKAGEYTLTGPFTHENLSVYLIHGEDRLKGKHYVTLQQALQDKIVVVYETGDVNALQIENVSTDVDVYIQSGDIVKGGRQDRTIAMDFIVPPRSGRMSLDAFCVENGRWTRRGGEDASLFASSGNAVAGNGLKLAVQKSANQHEVWRNVKENQDKLSLNSGSSVNDPRSKSSFELTLENKKVQEETDAYAKTLAKIVDGQNDAIGYVTAINGKIRSADVYASHELFIKLWPKQLNSASVEAFAELRKGRKFEPVKSEAVSAAIEDADKGQASSKDVTARVQLVTHESKDNIVFETRDRQAAPLAATGEWIHRSYLNKQGLEPASPARDIQRQIDGPANPAPNQELQQRRNSNAEPQQAPIQK